MEYSFHGTEAEIYDIKDFDELVKISEIKDLVSLYKVTRMYYLVQQDINSLIDFGIIIDDSEDGGGYPTESIENTLNKMTEILSYKLGEDVVESFNEELDGLLSDDNFKKAALTQLLITTSDSPEDADLFFQLMEMSKDPDFISDFNDFMDDYDDEDDEI